MEPVKQSNQLTKHGRITGKYCTIANTNTISPSLLHFLNFDYNFVTWLKSPSKSQLERTFDQKIFLSKLVCLSASLFVLTHLCVCVRVCVRACVCDKVCMKRLSPPAISASLSDRLRATVGVIITSQELDSLQAPVGTVAFCLFILAQTKSTNQSVHLSLTSPLSQSLSHPPILTPTSLRLYTVHQNKQFTGVGMTEQFPSSHASSSR